MSERKSINKYYPPDFDPSKIKKTKKSRKTGPPSWPTVRLMIPFSMRCLKCNEYISKSKKFNAKKEITTEMYLGIKVIQFHFKCPKCYNDLIFKTDPKNGDFTCVSGCKKNYEKQTPEVEKEDDMDAILERLEAEDVKEQQAKEGSNKVGDKTETAIEQLERRLVEQQREQELIEQIDELQTRNRNRELNKVNVLGKIEDVEETLAKEAEEAFRKFEDTKVNKMQNRGKENTKKVVSVTLGDTDSNKNTNTITKSCLLSGYSSTSDESSDEEEPQVKQITIKRKSNSLGVSVSKKSKQS